MFTVITGNADTKTYNVAGVSTLNGEVKMRVANSVARVKVLKQNGHTDIVLLGLETAMTKKDIAKQFLENLDALRETSELLVTDAAIAAYKAVAE